MSVSGMTSPPSHRHPEELATKDLQDDEKRGAPQDDGRGLKGAVEILNLISFTSRRINFRRNFFNRLTGKPADRQTDSGFSLVEIMITVVILGVCLVMALRVFSFCAAAVSEAYNSTYAVDILQEKIDEVEEQVVLAGGAEFSSCSEEIERGGREFTFTQEISDWIRPIIEIPEASEIETEVAIETEDLSTGLCEALFIVEWGASNRRKNIKVKTMFPAKAELINEYDI